MFLSRLIKYFFFIIINKTKIVKIRKKISAVKEPKDNERGIKITKSLRNSFTEIIIITFDNLEFTQIIFLKYLNRYGFILNLKFPKK